MWAAGGLFCVITDGLVLTTGALAEAAAAGGLASAAEVEVVTAGARAAAAGELVVTAGAEAAAGAATSLMAEAVAGVAVVFAPSTVVLAPLMAVGLLSTCWLSANSSLMPFISERRQVELIFSLE